MKVSQSFKDTAYGFLFLIVAIVIYMAQHECVQYGFEAAVRFYDHVKDMLI